MRQPRGGRGNPASLIAVVVAAVCLIAAGTGGQGGQVTRNNWGMVVSPVYGSSQPGYPDAELFAAPRQFGSEYYHGVLPNGRVVRPAGRSVQVGQKPLGARLTPDGKYLITSNNNDDDNSLRSQQSTVNVRGFSLSVVETSTMRVVSQISSVGKFFVGLQITGAGPYTVWASGGGDNDIKKFALTSGGTIAAAGVVPIHPMTASMAGFVSNYKPGAAFRTANASGNRVPAPTGFDRTNGAAITFPAGSALSPDGRFLYVACNGDNSLAIIDAASSAIVNQLRVGYFPYDVTVTADGQAVFVSNWGVTEYKFAKPTYDANGTLTALAPTGVNAPDGFYVPKTDIKGANPKTSSVSIVAVPGGDATKAALVRSIYLGEPLDELYEVGDTHPSAMALVKAAGRQYVYVTKANDDSIGIIALKGPSRPGEVPTAAVKKGLDLSPVRVDGVKPLVHGGYPNAIAISPDNTRAYVAEAGINAVAVLDIADPEHPRLLGRIPTGWYPTALAISADARFLYVLNARGVAEDLGPGSGPAPASRAPKVAGGLSNIDSNYIFGSAQRVDLGTISLDNRAALANNFTMAPSVDDRIVPAGGSASRKIRHVFFILHENKTFDSMLGNLSQLAPFASTEFKDPSGAPFTEAQYTPVSKNLQALASRFAVGVNYYSDAEESDAGHQFAASGTSSDYSQKTLDVKSGRGLLANKNMEPEDYPESGYIFNNAARNGVSFKDYGALFRVVGTDSGGSSPTSLDDPKSGNAGYPVLPVANPVVNQGDVDSPTSGLGQSYFLAMPALAVLGGKNANGEPRLDRNYPGYNFNISDQRRAAEFCRDFDRMIAAGTLPRFIYIYEPNDHTGSIVARNLTGRTAPMQVADGDVALGMIVEHIMRSPVYYDAATGEGSTIFVTFDDAQSTVDHVHPHRTPLVMVSPYAKPGAATRHYSTASIVKTEELLLGLPPNNLGDLFATDLRDMFQPTYNGVTADMLPFTRTYQYVASEEGVLIWALVDRLDTSAPDRDSRRLGALARLSMQADRLHADALARHELETNAYRQEQASLYEQALAVVGGRAERN